MLLPYAHRIDEVWRPRIKSQGSYQSDRSSPQVFEADCEALPPGHGKRGIGGWCICRGGCEVVKRGIAYQVYSVGAATDCGLLIAVGRGGKGRASMASIADVSPTSASSCSCRQISLSCLFSCLLSTSRHIIRSNDPRTKASRQAAISTWRFSASITTDTDGVSMVRRRLVPINLPSLERMLRYSTAGSSFPERCG